MNNDDITMALAAIAARARDGETTLSDDEIIVIGHAAHRGSMGGAGGWWRVLPATLPTLNYIVDGTGTKGGFIAVRAIGQRARLVTWED